MNIQPDLVGRLVQTLHLQDTQRLVHVERQEDGGVYRIRDLYHHILSQQTAQLNIQDLITSMLLKGNIQIMETQRAEPHERAQVILRSTGRMAQELQNEPSQQAPIRMIQTDAEGVETDVDVIAFTIDQGLIDAIDDITANVFAQQKASEREDQQPTNENVLPRSVTNLTSAETGTRARGTLPSKSSQYPRSSESSSQAEQRRERLKEQDKIDRQKRIIIEELEEGRALKKEAQGLGSGDPIDKELSSKSKVEKELEDGHPHS